jgi:hypothetical protein
MASGVNMNASDNELARDVEQGLGIVGCGGCDIVMEEIKCVRPAKRSSSVGVNEVVSCGCELLTVRCAFL